MFDCEILGDANPETSGQERAKLNYGLVTGYRAATGYVPGRSGETNDNETSNETVTAILKLSNTTSLTARLSHLPPTPIPYSSTPPTCRF
jgi:hypothetical protein